jgi:hypothetical protein
MAGMRNRLQVRENDSCEYDSRLDSRSSSKHMKEAFNVGAVVPKIHAVSRRKPSLNWLGIMLLALLLGFPLVVQNLPLGVRQYLSATVR